MIENNRFYVNSLEKIVFIGFSEVYEKLIQINASLNLATEIISSSDQSKGIHTKHVIFDKVDEKFYLYIQDTCNIEKTLFVSLGSRLIFRKKTIEFLRGNLINFHGTRLPLDAGGGLVTWKIMRQDRIDNQLVHLIDEGIDTGPIIHNSVSLFPKECSIPIDFESYRLNKFLDFYNSFIVEVLRGQYFNLKYQLDYLGRYNTRLSTMKHGYIDWSLESYQLYNFINAFDDPYPGSITFLNSGNHGPVHLKSVHLHGGDSMGHPFMAGLVSRHDKHWLIVNTNGRYSLIVEKVLNSSHQNIINFIKPGDRFFTPYTFLESSHSYKAIYSSKGEEEN